MTIKDIAAIANVSVSTVSRCLNDSPLVADSTKRRIKAIADTHGFEFNAGARSMVTQRAGTIALILPEGYEHFHVQLYHSGLHNDLRRALERAQIDLIVGFAHNRFDGSDNVMRMIRRGKVDGLIVVLPHLEKATEAFLQETHTPYVFSHYPPESERPDVDWVYVDHERGGMLVGEHFSRCAYRSIAVFGDPDGPLEFRQRVNGIRKALSLAGSDAELQVFRGVPSLEDGYRLVEENAASLSGVDAVFAMNDLMAIGAIQALQARGVVVPDDIAVVGYDDTPLAETLHPSLTTVRQPSEEVAFMTCERLIEMIDDRSRGIYHQPRHITLQPQLRVRQSSNSCGC